MACPKAFEELSAYSDGSLTSDEELSFRRHIDTCSLCQQKMKVLFALKDSVARSAEVYPIPHTLREAVRALPQPASRSIFHFSWTTNATLALVLFLAVSSVVSWVWHRGPGQARPEEIAQVLVADHIHFLQEPNALEISSADPAAVTAWFQSKVPFPVRIVPLHDARLIGGRLCSLLGQQAALVFYERRGKRLSLFTLARETIPPAEQNTIRTANQSPPQCLSPFGKYTVCLSSLDDIVVAVVTEEPDTDIVALNLFRSL